MEPGNSPSSAIVTGAASGLGRAVAIALANAGHLVVACDIRPADPIDGVNSESIVELETDVRSADDALAAAQTALSMGPLRTLVNCAGVVTAGRVVNHGVSMPLRQFTDVIDINLNGTFNMIRAAVPVMMQSEPVNGERGVIVNTASIAAFDGQIGQSAYSASKAGVVGLTLPLARELGRDGIRCVCIAPGVFATPMFGRIDESVQSQLAQGTPHPKRAGDPSEFADLVLAVLRNQMINGATIRIDGSLRMA